MACLRELPVGAGLSIDQSAHRPIPRARGLSGQTERMLNRAFRLRRRPEGPLADGDLELVEEEIAELRDGQALVRTQLLSLDPTNRIWMSDIRGYMPPVPIDAVMRGLGIGEVIESKRDDMPVGRDGQRLRRLAGATASPTMPCSRRRSRSCPTRCPARSQPSSAPSATPASPPTSASTSPS